jgi:hypothetical protein
MTDPQTIHLWKEHEAFMEGGDYEGAMYHADFVRKLGFDVAAEAMEAELKKSTINAEPSQD